MNNNYAQENEHMRKMEQEAYLQGNMCFRDWEDGLDDKLQYKMKLAEQKFLKENKNMSVKISKKELKGLIEKLLSERTKRDSKDRTGGRDVGGRRLKPLEEVEEIEEGGCGNHGNRNDGEGSSDDNEDETMKEEAGIAHARRRDTGCCDNCGDKSLPHKGDKALDENEVDPLKLQNTIQLRLSWNENVMGEVGYFFNIRTEGKVFVEGHGFQTVWPIIS